MYLGLKIRFQEAAQYVYETQLYLGRNQQNHHNGQDRMAKN